MVELKQQKRVSGGSRIGDRGSGRSVGASCRLSVSAEAGARRKGTSVNFHL